MCPLNSRLRPVPAPAKRATSWGRPAKSNPSGTCRLLATTDASGTHTSTSAPARQPVGQERLRERLLAAGPAVVS